MTITAVTGTSQAALSGAAQPAQSPASPPIPPSVMTSSEALALLGSLTIADSQSATARVSAERAEGQRKQAMIRAQKALQAARRSAKKSGWWGGLSSTFKAVATWAGVAAAASSVVATGGVSTPMFIVIAASAASYGMRQSGADGRVCTIDGIDFNASDVVLLGGAALAMGYGPGTDEEKADLLERVCAHVAVGATGVQAAATGANAVATEREGHFRARSLRESASAREEELRARHELELVEEAIETLRSAADFRGRAMQAVAEMLDTKRAAQAAVFGRRA